MTDNVSDSTESPAPHSGERDLDNSPGHQLRRAREGAGLSLEDLSRRLCMTVDKLELLERDDYDRLPSALYVRGYIRNACKELGIDPAPALEAFSGYAAAEEESRAIVEHVRRGPVIDNRPKRSLRGLALLPLLVVAGIFWWVNGRDLTPPVLNSAPVDPVAEETVADTPEAPTETAEFATAAAVETDEYNDPAGQEAEPQVAGESLAGESIAESTAEPAAPEPEPEAPAEELAAAESAAEPVPAAADSEPLQLTFTEEAWVEVKDASGAVLLAKLQPPGSQVAVDGEPPFELMLGNAAGTRVHFRGELVDSDPLGGRSTRKLRVGE
ncbi:RodZ domain-containing protein [Microbulbifer halophilus]|uniref:Helix-turn-helix domain-containing protein n=1 Tax=Microbulbifer halophilus TaxID=453963 RepID=A0ABW5EAX4_9GAMM|nr:RodZ domain-containing protein [Microbulbifer halophilus]MCW8125333.1 DUF4115 domain-containing protein [Microbulbifer halophilus]